MNHSSQSKPAVRAKIIKVKALCEHAALLPSAALLRSRGRLSASNNTAAGAVCQVFFADSALESKLSGRFAGFGGCAPQKTADHACGRAVTAFLHKRLYQPRHSQKLSLWSCFCSCGRAPPKNTRPFAKTPFGRFCSCGRAVTAFPRALTQTQRARFRKDCFPFVRAVFVSGVFLQLLFLNQVLHPDALLHQRKADGAFDEVDGLHAKVEGEHRQVRSRREEMAERHA